MTKKIIVNKENPNGIKVDLTEKEILQRENEESEWVAGAFDRAIADLRKKRNQLLAETDYLALSDNTMTDEMKDYRKKLRDLTKGLTTEKKVKAKKFPTKP
tara:strand:+ start:189 stop:491 length:303 start_codon:yes stop_codon:yes gene_type:complete